MSQPKSEQERQLKTICPQCGHNWLTEFRSFEECSYCLSYLQQAKRKPEFAEAIKKRYDQRFCYTCGQDLEGSEQPVENKGGSFCSLDCAIEHRRLHRIG